MMHLPRFNTMSKVSTLLCQEGNVVRGMMVKPTNLLPFPLSTANKKKKMKVTKRKKENKPKGKKLGDEDLNPSPGKKFVTNGGNGGWQSSCCTTTLSQHPLPQVPNKRHSRVGGKKMSGNVFSRLLSCLVAEMI
ncbi:hypothetical protein DY000_02057294 [Brassica cretica]|uniref:GAGA-binding transcriptional activator n=1 Tax=Brassica cretica TaxID=69181 RepID=A0ABQ7ADH3_BRACR|nr:hypothetical protein DY000_02057294 [Brassica cretica]